MSYVVDAGRADHGLCGLAQHYFRSCRHRSQRADQARQDQDHLRLRRRRPCHRLRRRGGRRRRCGSRSRSSRGSWPSVCSTSTRRWSGRSSLCSRAWSGAAFRSTARCCRGCPANSPRRPRPRSRDQGGCRRDHQSRQPEAARRRSVRQARPVRAAPRPGPANGRPARALSKSSPSRATCCRR